MLTALLTAIFALYILGPDLVGRWVVGFFAPSRARIRTYGEQITTACILSVIPLTLGWQFCKHVLQVYSPSNKILLAGFLQGVLAQDRFDQHAPAFYKALPFFFKLNFVYLLVVYGLVVSLAFYFGRKLKGLGRELRRRERDPGRLAALNFFFRPWTSEWHLRLSRMLLPDETTIIQVDVLTSMNLLYRGTLIEHYLDMNGALVSITLEGARKFRREEFVKDREAKPAKTASENYWSLIEGQFLLIRADQIATLNIRYVEASKPELPRHGQDELAELLKKFATTKGYAGLPPGVEKFQ